MKHILINIHYWEIGGAERALLGLLSALDSKRVQVDLFLNQHTGEFLPLVPSWVNLLPEISAYTCIERPISLLVKQGHLLIAAARLWAKFRHRMYARRLNEKQRQRDESIFQFMEQALHPFMPKVKPLKEYDLAINFLGQHYIVLDKERAKKKVTWIHTDYSTVYINPQLGISSWGAFDNIISISPECTKAFLSVFPSLQSKIVEIENILSPQFIRQQAALMNIDSEMPNEGEVVKILSIGRFSPPKNFEAIPEICAEIERQGVNFKWYIVGYGDDTQIQQSLDKYRMRHRMILLGKKMNPYPYIKACDIYIQPSIYEGKSVTVREAQILGKPVVITNYPTANSQITSGVDGMIVPLETMACAKGIVDFIRNKELQSRLMEYLHTHDFGNEKEVEKIYQLMNS